MEQIKRIFGGEPSKRKFLETKTEDKTAEVISKIMYKKSFKYLKPNKLQHQCELKASTGFLLLLHKPFCVQSDPVMYTLMQQILIHYLF